MLLARTCSTWLQPYLKMSPFTCILLLLYLINSACGASKTSKQTENHVNKLKDLIEKDLESFSEQELLDETKLTRLITEADTSDFFLFGNVNKTKVFSWKTPTKLLAKDTIVLQIKETQADGKIQAPWKSKIFWALKPFNVSNETSNTVDYFAIVAYDRWTSKDDEVLLEWDHWTPVITLNMEDSKKPRPLETEYFLTKEAVLCIYGSCGCPGCGCTTKFGNKEGLSQNGHAHAVAEVSEGGQSGESRASAISENGTAFADASSFDNRAMAYTQGGNNSVSSARSVLGGVKAQSVAKEGFAQALAQAESAQDDVIAKAEKYGETHNKFDDPDYDDEKDLERMEDDKSMDTAEAVFRSINDAFTKANQRYYGAYAQTLGVERVQRRNMTGKCPKELESVPVDFNKMANKPDDNSDLVSVGIDVEDELNKSVLITLKTLGNVIPRHHCNCNTNHLKSELLVKLQQNCRTNLVDRMELVKNYSDQSLLKFLQQKRLSRNDVEDALLSIIHKQFFAPAQEKVEATLKRAFKNTTSPNVTEMCAAVINALHYCATSGKLHKVKLYKGLFVNLRNVWNGLMLEWKRCSRDNRACSDTYVDVLVKDQKLVMGILVFFKSVETMLPSASNGSELAKVFLKFYKKYKSDIGLFVECKMKGITMGDKQG